MARKKIIKEGFHLKFIPKGRLDDLIQIADNFPEVQDKQLALWKVIEVFSSIVERQYDKKFVAVNYRVLQTKLGLKKGLKKLLKALIDKQFLDIDKSTFQFHVSSFSYKPIYDILDVIKIPRKFLNKNSNTILEGNRDSEIDLDVKLYETIINKITLDKSIHEYINNNNKSKLYSDSNTISKSLYESSSVPYEIVGSIPTELIPVYKI